MSILFDTNKKPANRQKLRGGYYTPLKLAGYLARWAIRTGTEAILEPSAGDGNFVMAALQQLVASSAAAAITAVEIEEREIQKAQQRVAMFPAAPDVRWICGDFFGVYDRLRTEGPYDVVLGNPPFIRFQHFEDDSRAEAFKHLRLAGYKPTKLANAWTAFVQLSIELLKDGGRMAMVVPAELLQVKYAAELRSRLGRYFEHIVLVGFRKLVFPEIQQEVLLLLAEGKRNFNGVTSDIHTVEVEDGDHLIQMGDLDTAIAHVPSRHSRNGMKWTALFLSADVFKVLDEAQQSDRLTALGELAEVDVGIVTGRNSFFVMSAETREQLSAADFTVPIVGRTSALNSILFRDTDFHRYQTQYPAFLLNLTGLEASSLPPGLLNYLAEGQQENVHTGFKCRIRRRWYDVPSVYAPDAFLFRQIHRYPLLVVNEARAASTDTIHRVRLKKGILPRLLAACFYNSLTLAWAEVGGRSYGGGVLELEPREAEELPIPYNENIRLDVEKVDTLLRQGKDGQALDYVDTVVLKGYLGFDTLTVHNIRQAWVELRNRRINRR